MRRQRKYELGHRLSRGTESTTSVPIAGGLDSARIAPNSAYDGHAHPVACTLLW